MVVAVVPVAVMILVVIESAVSAHRRESEQAMTPLPNTSRAVPRVPIVRGRRVRQLGIQHPLLRIKKQE